MSTHAEPDWAALERSPQFRELMASRRRFLVAGTAFYSTYFLVYLCLLGFAPDAMSSYLFGSVTLANSLFGHPREHEAIGSGVSRVHIGQVT